jgi:RTX calcium-binding nonapeptide repeat (4 copies)/Periplasmic copper-binding protein (NosD)
MANIVTLDDTPNTFLGTVLDDIITGLGGADVLLGASGNDSIIGNADNDFLSGEAGIDFLSGGAGNDSLVGGDEADNLSGEDGDDLIFGNRGNDVLGGGTGNDSLYAGQGDDFIVGNDGNDLLFGDSGNDSLYGNVGDDSLTGNLGSDYISAGKGNDIVRAGQDNDFVLGDDGDDSLSGDLGNDIVGGGPGSDTIEGGDGNDYLSGGDGNDRVLGSLGQDTLVGGAGGDVYVLIDDMGSADIVIGFKANEDSFNLGGALLFSDLKIEQGNGFNINDTIISNKTSGQLIALVQGVPASTITAQNFPPGGGGSPGPGGGDGNPPDPDPQDDDEGLSATPKLRGGEVLVANAAGVVGEVAATGEAAYTIAEVTNADNEILDGEFFTIDNSGKLTLTEAGVTELESTPSLRVTVARGENKGTIPIPVYKSIADAIDDELIGDDTDTSVGGVQNGIKLAAGTYEDALTLSKSIKLLGPNAGKAGTDEARTDETEAKIMGGIIVNAADVQIDGLQFAGNGIEVQADADNLIVSNNRFTEMTTTAIAVEGIDKGNIANNFISVTTAAANTDGIFVDSLTGTTITNNAIDMPAAGGSGIEIGGTAETGGASANVTISENDIIGAAGAGTARTDGGITLRNGNFASLAITNNTVEGYSAAATTGSLLIVANTAISQTSQVSITGNTLAAALPGLSIFVDSTQVPALAATGNFSVSGTALVAANVSSSGTTNFTLT